MKLTLQLLLGLSLILFTISCQSASSKTLSELRDNPFPSFEEIYTHVNKQLTAPGENCQFGLAKKADGYYLKIIPYKNNDAQEPKFIKAWDAATKKYLTLDIDKYLALDYHSFDYKDGLQYVKTSGKSFDLNYFFGYPNYTADLINLMKDQEDLSSKELEMLARAYSNEACDYIHPNQLGSEISATKDLPDPMYEKISDSRISNFLRLAKQSLACYKKIRDKDPSYKTTIIEDLDLKVNHDLVNYYLQLKSVKEDQHAEEMLKLASYKPDAIAYAKELLDDCTQNGVLITSGDTDTFPLWFIQEKLNYRKDVTILNHSLIQAAWYFAYIRHTSALKSSFTEEAYSFYSQNYIVLSEAPDITQNYADWLTELRSVKSQELSDPKKNVSWEDMPIAPKNVLIDIQGTSALFSSSRGYMSGADLCILDLLNVNKDRRFYSTSVYPFSENNLREHLVKRNSIYELVPAEVKSNWDKESSIQLLKGLQTHPVKILSTGLTEIQMSIIYSKCFDWILMPKDEVESNQASFELFLKQLPIQTVAESSDMRLIKLYGGALWVMNSKRAEQFSDRFAPKALQLIANIDEQGICSETDAENLYTIYSIYVGRKAFDFTNPNKNKNSDIQQKVIRALKNKAEILCNNPLNIKNLSWTLELLTRIKEEANSY